MPPLARRTRLIYLYTLVVLFFVALPAVIFYAHGYRLSGGMGFLKTGGIFLSVPYADASVRLNGETVGESGILRRTFYLGDLSAGSYSVDVTKEGHIAWRRTLVVEPELVTDADVLLVPIAIDVVELSSARNAPTTTERISAALFADYAADFRAPTPTTTPSRIGRLAVENGNVYLRWHGKGVVPSIYCVRPTECADEVVIEGGKQRALHAALFEGAIVYATREGGVFIAEADARPTPLTTPLYSKPGSDFRILDNRLVVKDGERLYEISGI